MIFYFMIYWSTVQDTGPLVYNHGLYAATFSGLYTGKKKNAGTSPLHLHPLPATLSCNASNREITQYRGEGPVSCTAPQEGDFTGNLKIHFSFFLYSTLRMVFSL